MPSHVILLTDYSEDYKKSISTAGFQPHFIPVFDEIQFVNVDRLREVS